MSQRASGYERRDAKGRRHVFADCPAFAGKIVLTRRIKWFDGPASPSVNHAWFLWQRTWIGERQTPTIRYAPTEAAEMSKVAAEPHKDDGFRSYTIGHAALREQMIRAGTERPFNDTERRWAAEGYRPVRELECVRVWVLGDQAK